MLPNVGERTLELFTCYLEMFEVGDNLSYLREGGGSCQSLANDLADMVNKQSIQRLQIILSWMSKST